MKRIPLSVLIIIFLSVFSSCDSLKKEAGTFAVKFSWAKDAQGKDVKPDISTGEFYITVRIYEWAEDVEFPGDIEANGKQLTRSDPAQMKEKGTNIDFGNLSYGKRRFVVAEIRKGKELTGGILFSGMSGLFDFKVGKHTEVNVEMSMTPNPGVDEEGERIDAELRIVDENGDLQGYLNSGSMNVKLRLIDAVSFNKVFIANKEEFIKTENGKQYALSDLKALDQENSYEFSEDWDLSMGLTSDELSLLPELKVYARVENDSGQGILLMAKVAVDNKSPELTLGLNPSYTNGTRTIDLNISSNELITYSSIDITTVDPKLIFDCPEPENNESLSFTCTVETLDSSIKDGDHEITVKAADQAGNAGEQKATLTVDRELPELTFAIYKNDTEAEGNIYLKDGDKFKVELTLSKTPEETPVVRLGSSDISCKKDSDLKYTCEAEIKKDTHSEGISDLSVSYQDLAENRFNETIISGIRLDYTAPVLIISTNKDIYNALDNVVITVQTNEELQSAPTVKLDDSELSDASVEGNSWVYKPSLVNGTHNITATGTDLAGNPMTEAVSLSYTVDAVSPVADISDLSADRVQGNTEVTFTVTKKEGGEDLATIEVRNFDGSFSECTDGECSYTTSTGTTGVDSTETITVVYTDAAGNSVTDTAGNVYVDRTAPDLTVDFNKSGTPPFFNANDTIRISVTSSEILSSINKVTLDSVSYVELPVQIGTYTYLLEINPSDISNGSHTIVFEGEDLVNHPGSSSVAQFSVDAVAPSVQNFVVKDSAGDPASKFKNGDNYTIEFEIIDTELLEDPVVRFDGSELDTCSTDVDLKVVCNLTALESDGNGIHFFQANITDAAGNNSPNIQLGSIEYDVVGPEVTGADFRADSQFPYPVAADVYSFSRYEPYSDNVNTVYLNVYSNEALDEEYTPVLTYSGGGTTGFSQAVMSGKKVTFSMVFSDSEPAGETQYSYQIQWKDEIGNIVTQDVPAQMIIKDSKPSGEDLKLSNIVFRRVPWGADSTGGVPYFSMKMDDEGETAIEAGKDIAEISVYNSNGGMVGTISIDENGKFEETELSSGDQTKLYINPVNRYGVKEFDPDEIQDRIDDESMKYTTEIEWTATMGGKVPGSTIENPHEFRVKKVFSNDLNQNVDNNFNIDYSSLFSFMDGKVINTVSTLTWSEYNFIAPLEKDGILISYDTSRSKIVIIFKSDEIFKTWEWDGNIWKDVTPLEGNPTAKFRSSVVFDSRRGKVVLFGGRNGDLNFSNEMWEWNGKIWKEIPNSGVSPSPRIEHSMAYDSRRGKIVLFGGNIGDNGLSIVNNDTWEWDGKVWLKRNPSTKPPARKGHSMAYDIRRGNIILFGGYGESGALNDTWEWDGDNWIEMSVIEDSPSQRFFHSMDYNSDIGRTILYGGWESGGHYLNDLWAWNGEKWKKINTDGEVPSSSSHYSLAFDSKFKRMILMGTNNNTWKWDNKNWERMNISACPSKRSQHAMAYDAKRQKIVLFGGSTGGDETWEWDGTTWKEITILNDSPTGRIGHGMVYNKKYEKTLLFGGSTGGDETWEWDGKDWELKTPDTKPSARKEHAMAYDDKRQKIVLFGGSTGGDETWEWGGEQWEKRIIYNDTPSARFSHEMIYDNHSEELILFGGIDVYGFINNESWSWNGKNWNQIGNNQPDPRTDFSMSMNGLNNKLFLFAGTFQEHNLSGHTFYNDIWIWNGVDWEELFLEGERPVVRSAHKLVYDNKNRNFLLFGGCTAFSDLGDTWVLDDGSQNLSGHLNNIFFNTSYTYNEKPIVKKIYITSYSGGTGYGAFDCSAVNGANMLLWNTAYKNGAWMHVASNQAGSDNPEKMEFYTEDQELLKHLFFGDDKSINIAITPVSPNGCGDEMGSVSTDYIETTVRYTLDESYTPPDAYCGNGVIDESLNEECDDGNYGNGDGCSILCKIELCGNGTVDIGELCDKTASGGINPYCTDECDNIIGRCGDLNIDTPAGEQCDDGNTFDGDGCSVTCTVEPCGNGVLDQGEECDDGNTFDGDGCSSICESEGEQDCQLISPGVTTCTLRKLYNLQIGTTTSSEIDFSPYAETMGTMVYATTLSTLKFNVEIKHEDVGDLRVWLTSPDNTDWILHNNDGGDADNIYYNASLPPDETGPYGTNFSATIFQGEETEGVWTLNVENSSGDTQGTLDEWGITIYQSYCGDGTILDDEVCETGDIKNCTEITHDPAYVSGMATCLSDCSDWDESTCSSEAGQNCQVISPGVTTCTLRELLELNNGATKTSTINFSPYAGGLGTMAYATTLSTLKFNVDIKMDNVQHLEVWLTSPENTDWVFHDNDGGISDDIIYQACLPPDNTGPYGRSFDPMTFQGEETEGEWTLTITNNFFIEGTLDEWGITIYQSEYCGDGIINGPEWCDDGEKNGVYTFCNDDCSGPFI